MARPPKPLPSALGRAFTAEQARRAGVPPRRLRARDIEHPYRGLLAVRADAAAGDRETDAAGPFGRDRMQQEAVRARADLYRPLMVAPAFFSGRTAAALWGLPIDGVGDLDVAVMAPHRAPRRRGIRGRQIAPDLVAVREIEGLRVASPASVWAMLATELSVRELVRIGDAIVRVPSDDHARRHPELALATVDQLMAAAEAGRRQGIGRLRAAIGEIRVGSASPLETDYRLDAATAGLPEPELDVEIRDPHGRLLGITEVFYREFRTLVEIEGDHHRTSREQWNRDIEKYAAYVAAGYEVVRLTASHIRGPQPRAAAIVREVLLRRGWQP